MTPVDDVRFCPYERETLPADHDCIGDSNPKEESAPDE